MQNKITAIIIPTLGRIDKQITYHNLPKKYKDITYFVIQEHEYNDMSLLYGDNKVLCLPKEIKSIAPTREWIHNKFKNECYFVFDDDIDFVIKTPIRENETLKWNTKYFDENDFDDMFKLISKWLNEGYIFGGLQAAYILPNEKLYPETENFRVLTNVFYNGPKIPNNIQWNRVPFGEDLDVELQLLTQGFKNKVSIKYMAKCKPTGYKGGCSLQRTLEEHNKSQLKLKELWPNFVTIREKEEKQGLWKGQKKLNIIVQHKKAFNSSIQLDLLKDL